MKGDIHKIKSVMKNILASAVYANGEGFLVGIVKPPKGRPWDTIGLITVKNRKGSTDYYTPDEAMSVAIGLLRAVDVEMGKAYRDYRKDKEN